MVLLDVKLEKFIFHMEPFLLGNSSYWFDRFCFLVRIRSKALRHVVLHEVPLLLNEVHDGAFECSFENRLQKLEFVFYLFLVASDRCLIPLETKLLALLREKIHRDRDFLILVFRPFVDFFLGCSVGYMHFR